MSNFNFKSLAEVRDFVIDNGNVATVQTTVIRDAYGKGRLGSIVRSNISKELKSLGIGHYPAEIPDSQYAMLRLYRLGTAVADIIDAVLLPSEAHDAELRAVGSNESDHILNEIRELVCGS